MFLKVSMPISPEYSLEGLKLKLQYFKPLDAKNWLIEKDPDAGKDWRQEEKGTTEDEMVGWHHGLDGHEFEQALGAGDGQGSLVWCSPWDCKESNTTEWLSCSDGSFMILEKCFTLTTWIVPAVNWKISLLPESTREKLPTCEKLPVKMLPFSP